MRLPHKEGGQADIMQIKEMADLFMEAGFTDEQRSIIKAAQEEMKRIPLIPCTTCNYCVKVCPMEIGISGSFTAMNILQTRQGQSLI